MLPAHQRYIIPICVWVRWWRNPENHSLFFRDLNKIGLVERASPEFFDIKRVSTRPTTPLKDGRDLINGQFYWTSFQLIMLLVIINSSDQASRGLGDCIDRSKRTRS